MIEVMFEYCGEYSVGDVGKFEFGRRSKNRIVSNAMTGWRVELGSTHWKGYTESAHHN